MLRFKIYRKRFPVVSGSKEVPVMTKYRVTVVVAVQKTFEVDAENLEAANKDAVEMFDTYPDHPFEIKQPWIKRTEEVSPKRVDPYVEMFHQMFPNH
jgi:hypothetical protein